ncbi:sulfatase-like hydrolase/transferase [Aureliella helgolandensis]|uniref:sulfatase-like hydrolase/transferase n=1 Tax=Aureliella helgolandensis TaxID=2527968 RepID=UPI0018D082F5|nr:sulfatase-like hydrolase/transferase [Aureliella helgolandensis]
MPASWGAELSPIGATAPNVVFILADDLGWRDLSCYGSPLCETPHIDALAATGMRFTNAYSAASICSPTRASLMTGKHPVRTGVTDYIPGLKSKPEQMRTPRTARQLALEEVTLGEMFQQAGYETMYAGKWHLGGVGYEPPDQGFDVYVGDRQLGPHGRDWTVGTRITAAFDEFVTARQAAEASAPFLAYLSFHEPHIPILEYPEHINHFQQKVAGLGESPAPRAEREGRTRMRQDDAAYGSEVAGLDDLVGQVVATLDHAGLREETLIVFYSDNGGLSTKSQPGPTSNLPLRAGKGWLYEGGLRVPLLVSLPGKIEPASVSDQLTVSYDLVPTLLDLVGAEVSVNNALPPQALDGRSLQPILLGDVESLPARAEYWHYPHYHGSTWAPGAAMRDGDWKLIQFDHYGQVELYNLAEDPSETKDLAAEHPERVADMQQRLAAWQASVGARFAQPKNLAVEELVAWCIVPFDASRRGPEARAQMLQELGLRKLAYDWREEHVATWDAEIDALAAHDIELTAFWCSSSLSPGQDPGTQRILDFLRRRQVTTQLWVMLPDHELSKIDDEAERVQRAALALRQYAELAGEIGCQVGLYNHGGWIGRPEIMVRVMRELSDLDNLGIVYNLHHAHGELDQFPTALRAMLPYLMCVNLNGTTVGGEKIVTLGEGTLDAEILGWLRQVQYSGPIGILDHRGQLDAKESLEMNLTGLRALIGPVE